MGDHRFTSSVDYDIISFTAPDTKNVVVTNSGGSDICIDEGSGDVTVTGRSDEIGTSCTIIVSVAGNAAFAAASYQVTVQLAAAFHFTYSVTGAPYSGCYRPGDAIPPIVISGDRVDELEINLVGANVLDGYADVVGDQQKITTARISPNASAGTTLTAILDFGYNGQLLFTADPSTPYVWNVKDACP